MPDSRGSGGADEGHADSERRLEHLELPRAALAAGQRAIEWAFNGNPAPFAVARHGGITVGMSGYIQSRMQFGEYTGTATQAVGSFISETLRGQGIFTRLAKAYDERARQSGKDLVWGFPNDNAAPAWFGKIG
jgi:hypothetical protein